jgi:hypothetical protein
VVGAPPDSDSQVTSSFPHSCPCHTRPTRRSHPSRCRAISRPRLWLDLMPLLELVPSRTTARLCPIPPLSSVALALWQSARSQPHTSWRLDHRVPHGRWHWTPLSSGTTLHPRRSTRPRPSASFLREKMRGRSLPIPAAVLHIRWLVRSGRQTGATPSQRSSLGRAGLAVSRRPCALAGHEPGGVRRASSAATSPHCRPMREKCGLVDHAGMTGVGQRRKAACHGCVLGDRSNPFGSAILAC